MAGQALDALDGRWTPTHCADPATGTWTVLGNRIQFFWPTDRVTDALEEVVREEPDVVETVVVSPELHKGRALPLQHRWRRRADRQPLQRYPAGGAPLQVKLPARLRQSPPNCLAPRLRNSALSRPSSRDAVGVFWLAKSNTLPSLMP